MGWGGEPAGPARRTGWAGSGASERAAGGAGLAAAVHMKAGSAHEGICSRGHPGGKNETPQYILFMVKYSHAAFGLARRGGRIMLRS